MDRIALTMRAQGGSSSHPGTINCDIMLSDDVRENLKRT